MDDSKKSPILRLGDFFVNMRPLLMFLSWSLLLVGCDNKLPIARDELLGKTKAQIIAFSFEKSTPVLDNEIQIASESLTGASSHFYFKRQSDALAKSELMKSDIWHVCFQHDPWSIRGRNDYWRITFRDGKVADVQPGAYSEF